MSEKVLIVDDEVDFLELMEERLVARGIEVSTSSSAEDALKRIEMDLFDAVILDLQMPGMNGMEALKRIKEQRPEIQVILLTGHGTIETAVLGMKLGAYDYMLKPADPVEIARKLEGARNRKKEQEDRIREAEQKTLPQKG